MAKGGTGRRLLRAVPLVAVTGGSLVLAYRAGVAGRWHWMSGVLLSYLALALCLVVWVVYYIFVIPGGPVGRGMRKHWRLGLFVLAGLLAVGACHFATRLGGTRSRSREVQAALDAGLRADCLALIGNWPSSNDRIFPEDPEFQQLPASVRMLEPLYVTNDTPLPGYWHGAWKSPSTRTSMPSFEHHLPPNIGICKNGFGGFHMGVRVFVEEEGLPVGDSSWWFVKERLAPNVYVWTEGT